ncbi:MAG TPA: ABC transporter family substrate-binding protein [Trebonia sp.]|nr:ABC transporter family substrate-binding protein [Trebonia sp.]
MKNKRIFGGLALALAGMTALAACSSSSSSSSTPSSSSSASAVKSGGTLTYALDQDVAGFNINQATDTEFVLQEIMNPVWPTVFVTQPNISLKLDTDYVTSAKVTSTSPQTIVYQINPKAVWSDGVAINADDFIYAWQSQSGNPKYTDVGGKAFEPASTAGYNQVKSVTGSNGGKTVTVVFSSPFGDWQSLFSDLMPAHIAKTVGFNNGFQTFNSAVKVSGGPFEIQSYTQGQSLIEVPNPKWFGAAPKLSKLVFRFFADDNQIPPAIQNSEVDAANPAQASLQFKDAVSAVPNTTTNIIPGLEFQHMDFNQANPYLAKLDVRLAIAAGTNRNVMVQRILGPITTSVKPLDNRIYMPTQSEHQDTSGGLGDFNPTKAKQLLQSSGMTMGSDGYMHPNFGPQAGKDLTLSISTTSGEPVRAEIEQLFQADMKAIGIKINIQNYSPNTLFGTVGPKSEFDIIEFAWVATPFASSNQPIYCSFTNSSVCGENWDHYANPQVDALFTQALTTLDPAKAVSLYNQADALLWKDMVTLPLFQQPQLYTWDTKWANIVPNPSSTGLTWNAQTWGLKAT